MPNTNQTSFPKTNSKSIQQDESREKNNLQNISYSNSCAPVKTSILGVGVTNESKENILEYIVNSIENSAKNYYITTPNPEMVVSAQSHPKLMHILNNAQIALNDGVGLSFASRLLEKGLKERLSGVDAMELLCEKVARKPITVGFFGAGPKVAEKTAECLKKKYPDLRVAFVGDVWPWDEGKSAEQNVQKSQTKAGTSKKLGGSTTIGTQLPSQHPTALFSQPQPRIDILFVALGFPKQELWMAEHLNKIPVKVMMGVGGAFDYVSGTVPRAPKFLRSVGLEWLFRLIVQPWRLKRQLALPVFVWLVLKEKIRK